MSKFTTVKIEKSSPKSSVKRSGKVSPKKILNNSPKKSKKKRGKFGVILEKKRDESRGVKRVDRRGEKLSKNRQKILDTFKENPTVSSDQLVEIVGIGSINIEKDIRYLKAHGWICKVGTGEKGQGHWEVINE